MDVWVRLRGLGLTWSGLAATLIAFVAALFLRRLLPEGRTHRGKATVVLLAIAPVLHFFASGVGLLGFPAASAVLHLVNLLFLALGITGAVSLLVFDVTLGRTRVPTIARDILQALAFMVVFFGVLHASGFDPLSLLTTSAILTAVIGLAFQNIMANLLAGLALQIDRTFVTGDWIQVGARIGRIEEIRWRSTAIRTKEGDTAIIPNASLLSNEVLNFSKPSGTHLSAFAVPFHHRHPPDEVKAVVLRAVAGVTGVLADPPPACSPDEFGRGAVVYKVRYWIADFAVEGKVAAEVKTRLWYAARRAGSRGPALPAPAASRWPTAAPPPAAPSRIASSTRASPPWPAWPCSPRSRPTSAPGSPATSARCSSPPASASSIRASPETRSTCWRAGEVRIDVESDGARREVARLGAGEVFGEMSLLTGEPRQASCTALTDVRCYLVDYPLARRVLSARPAMAVEISAELSRRLAALEGERAHLAAPAEETGPDAPAQLLARMKAYFRLD